MSKKKLVKVALVMALSAAVIVPNATALGLDTIVAQAENELETEGLAGGVKWSYEDGVLTFTCRDDLEGEYASGIGRMAGADSSSEFTGYRAYADVVTKVVFADGIVSIGRGDFEDFTALTTVEMADSITLIEPEAFKNCSKLVNVTMPEHLKEICADSFYGTAIKSVSFGKELASFWCNPFRYCKNLESITVSDENEIWTDCDSNIITTKDCVEVFAGCTNSTIPNGIKWVKDGAFQGTGITNVVFPEGFEQIYGTAFQDTPLVSVSFPSTFNAYGLHAENFYNCTQLKYVNFKNAVNYSQRDIFGNCTSLEEIVFAGDANWLSGFAFRGVEHLNIYVNKDTKPYQCTIGDLDRYGVKVDLYYEGSEEDFQFRVKEDNLTIHYNSYYPEAPVDASGNTTYKNGDVHWVLMGDTLVFSGTGATYLPGNFAYKDVVKKVVISDDITWIGTGTFKDFTNLEEVKLGSKVSHIQENAFYGCTSLKTIELPDSLSTINERAFAYSGLTSITIPKKITMIYEKPFIGCKDLKTMTVADGNTYCMSKGNAIYVKGGDSAFTALMFGCSGTVIEPGTKKILENAFENAGLAEVILPDSVKEIGSFAFADPDLKEIYIPKSVTTIYDEPFGAEGETVDVYYEGTEEEWASIDFRNRMDRCEVHYNSVPLYKGWVELDGKTYYYSATHEPMIDWQKIDGKWYYLGTDGVMTTGWQQLGGKWYYLGTDGVMTTGWQQISNKWYYFAGSGAMATGWQQISGKWYYFAGSGAMVTGWQQISGKWYYFAGSGAMATGWQQISGKWYYFAGSGAMVTGWQQISGKWYYFETSGAMAASKWIDGIYYVKSNGVMATDEWVDGGKYYVDANGKWVKGKTK